MSNFGDLRFQFRTEYLVQPDGSLKAVDYVDLTKVGQDKLYNVPQRMKDVMRETTGLWEHIEPHYNAWKAGETLPEEGTPLASWGGIPPAMAKALRSYDVKTVEDVAAMTETTLAKIGLMGLRDVVRAAKAWEEAKGTRDIAKALNEKDAQIQAMQDQMAVMMEMLQARDNTEEPVKRKPGRPRKEEGEVEEAAA